MTGPRIVLGTGACARTRGALVLDHRISTFWMDGRPIARTTPPRFRLLAMLIARAPAVVGWDDLCEGMWGDDEDGGSGNPRNYVFVTLHDARHVLGKLRGRVATLHGRGLVFVFDDVAERIAA